MVSHKTKDWNVWMGARLEKAVSLLGMSRSDVANLFGVSEGYVRAMMRGLRPLREEFAQKIDKKLPPNVKKFAYLIRCDKRRKVAAKKLCDLISSNAELYHQVKTAISVKMVDSRVKYLLPRLPHDFSMGDLEEWELSNENHNE